MRELKIEVGKMYVTTVYSKWRVVWHHESSRQWICERVVDGAKEIAVVDADGFGTVIATPTWTIQFVREYVPPRAVKAYLRCDDECGTHVTFTNSDGKALASAWLVEGQFASEEPTCS